MSRRVGINYNVREMKECRHEALEERRENGIQFTKGRVGLKSRKFMFGD